MAKNSTDMKKNKIDNSSSEKLKKDLEDILKKWNDIFMSGINRMRKIDVEVLNVKEKLYKEYDDITTEAFAQSFYFEGLYSRFENLKWDDIEDINVELEESKTVLEQTQEKFSNAERKFNEIINLNGTITNNIKEATTNNDKDELKEEIQDDKTYSAGTQPDNQLNNVKINLSQSEDTGKSYQSNNDGQSEKRKFQEIQEILEKQETKSKRTKGFK